MSAYSSVGEWLDGVAREKAEPPLRASASPTPEGGSALPCLSYNNSTETEFAEGTRLTFPVDKSRANAGRRLAFQAVGLVGDFVGYWGHEHVAMWTLTPEKGSKLTPREFARNWNSLRAHELDWLKGYLRFLEPQQRGDPHYHVIAAVGWDLEPSKFDWASFQETCRRRCKASGAFLETQEQFEARRRTPEWKAARARYVASAPEETRALWALLRQVLPKYGFGRSEFLPLRDKTGAAVYTGGYLRTGVQHRFGDWKGVRLIESDRVTSQLWRKHGRAFMFNQTGERIWRYQVAEYAKMVGVKDAEGMVERYGSKWCFHHRERIQRIDAPSVMFTAVNQDGKALEPVNLAEYQRKGREAIAFAFAKANGWTKEDAWVYLYGRGTVADCTSKTNEAIRQQELGASPASSASPASPASLVERVTIWDDGDLVKPQKVAKLLRVASPGYARAWEEWGEEKRLERVALEVQRDGEPF